MSAIQAHIKTEMEILKRTSPDSLLIPYENAILDLASTLQGQGHSGASAAYTIGAVSEAVRALLSFQTIAPLTGDDDEWANISDCYSDDEEWFQNKRDSRVFKNGTTGQCTFLDAIVFNGNLGGKFVGNIKHNGKTISSKQIIKSFPFTPKTFFVDVIDHRWTDRTETVESPDGDWWTHTLQYPDQLKTVYAYYQEPTNENTDSSTSSGD